MDEEEKRFYQNAKFPEGEGGVRMLARMNEGHHEQLAAWGFAQLSPQPGAQILDVGCGGGANLLRLLERSPLGTVTGVDYSQTSVETSEKTCAEAIKEGRCRVQLADVADLPFRDRSFDFVSAFETIYFWPDIVRSLAEVRRVLKPGGSLVCLEFSTPPNAVWRALYNFYLKHLIPFWGGLITGDRDGFVYLSKSIKAFPNQQGLARMMEDAGFTDVTWKNYTGGIAAVHVAKKPE